MWAGVARPQSEELAEDGVGVHGGSLDLTLPSLEGFHQPLVQEAPIPGTGHEAESAMKAKLCVDSREVEQAHDVEAVRRGDHVHATGTAVFVAVVGRIMCTLALGFALAATALSFGRVGHGLRSKGSFGGGAGSRNGAVGATTAAANMNALERDEAEGEEGEGEIKRRVNGKVQVRSKEFVVCEPG